MSSRDKLIAAALQHAEQGRYDLAIQEYERMLVDHPDDLRSRAKLGFLHARNGDTPAAVELWLEVVHAYEQRGADAEAAVILQQVLQLDPNHVDAHLWLAQLFGKLGQPTESRHELESAHTLLEQRGRMFEALRVLEDIVVLDPGNVALCIRLGEAYAAADRKEEAVDVLSRAADVLRLAEWVDDFIRVAERLVWLDPGNVAINKELATLYLRQRNPQAALQRLQHCYEADQGDTDTLKLLADTFIDLREPEKAATILRVLAEVYEQQGKAERADAVLDQAHRLDPEFQAEESGVAGTQTPDTVARPDPRGPQPDPTVLELGEGDWTWLPPAAADDADLSPLEMSLQRSGPDEDAPPRFLPAVTAEGRHGRETTAPQHRTVTTQELDLSDLIFLEKHRAATTQVTALSERRPQRTVTTTELDLSDIEEMPLVHTVTTQELEPDEVEGAVEARSVHRVTTQELEPDEGEGAVETRSVHRIITEVLVPGEIEEAEPARRETTRRNLNTHEQALSELEELAGELSNQYFGSKPGKKDSLRDRETVKFHLTPPDGEDGPSQGPDDPVEDTRRSHKPKEGGSEPTTPGGRRGRRNRS